MQHSVFQFRRNYGHQGTERYNSNGAGQRPYAGHLGGFTVTQLASV